MAVIFIDGFDKYGPANSNNSFVNSLITTEWTVHAYQTSIVAPLSATGQAVSLNINNMTKNLNVNLSTIVGGFRFQASSIGIGQTSGITFLDSSNAQVSLTINNSGTISVNSGALNATALGTSTASITVNSIHYLEWTITIGTSASYQVWLDGTSILSGTGNTRAGSTNNFVNVISPCTPNSGTFFIIDDLYIFDTTGSINNAVLLTNPRIETQFPNNDSSVQFSFGAAILGQAYQSVIDTNAPGADQLFLRKFTSTVSCTLNSVACIPNQTSATAKFKAVAYSDSAGSPSTLLSSGTEVVGTTSGTTLTGALVTPQSLTLGTSYWIGFITDTSVVLQEVDSSTTGEKAANTYTSGAPGTAPAMTIGQSNWIIYGNVTGTGINYYEVDINPPPGDISFVFDSTVGHEDLYQFPNLTTTPAAIYTVAVKGYMRNATSGARTIDMRMHSGTTESGGSHTGQSPATTYGWMDSFFDTDPNTSAAWTPSGLNNAKSGVKIDS